MADADRFRLAMRRMAMGVFDCRLTKEAEFGSHRILMGTVLDVVARDDQPLVYADCGYRSVA